MGLSSQLAGADHRERRATGNRPRNRRALIMSAAAEHFYEHGYDQVGMADIARSVGVGPSALYRHFPSKQDLLTSVVLDGIGRFRDLIIATGGDDPEALFLQLSRLTLQERRLGVLVQRESRNMLPSDREALRSDIRAIIGSLTALVAAVRPDTDAGVHELLAWSVMAVTASTSFHHHELPPNDYENLLADTVRRVVRAPVAAFRIPGRVERRSGLPPRSRREALLVEAIRLFGERGYVRVSLDDIGASLGIAGPSVYNHFPNKGSLFEAIIQRGTAYLMMDLDEILSASTGPEDALGRLIDSYLHVAGAHPHMVSSLIADLSQLPGPVGHQYRQVQREYVGEWVHLLEQIGGAAGQNEAWIRVQATLTLINDTARTPRVSRSPDFAVAVRTIARHVLMP